MKQFLARLSVVGAFLVLATASQAGLDYWPNPLPVLERLIERGPIVGTSAEGPWTLKVVHIDKKKNCYALALVQGDGTSPEPAEEIPGYVEHHKCGISLSREDTSLDCGPDFRFSNSWGGFYSGQLGKYGQEGSRSWILYLDEDGELVRLRIKFYRGLLGFLPHRTLVVDFVTDRQGLYEQLHVQE